MRGIKHTQKAILNGIKGIAVFTADTTPMDLITHLLALCEEAKNPYIFTKSQEDIKVLSPKSQSITCCFIKMRDIENDETIRKIVSKCFLKN